MVTWRAVQHPNVLPFLGVVMTGDRFAMVSEWMSNGNVKEFTRTYPNANRYELVSHLSNPIVSLDAFDRHRCFNSWQMPRRV